MKKLLNILIIIVISGCSSVLTKPEIFYSEAKTHKIINEHFYNTNADVVWNRLVQNLSSSPFVIDYIRYDSRIINASFEISEGICEYIDAGFVQMSSEITVDYPRIKKEDKVYNYNVCKRNNVIIQDVYPTKHRSYIPIILDYNRDPTLNGKINIYVAPRDSGTVVVVECSYIFNVKVTGILNKYHVHGDHGFGPTITRDINKPLEANVAFTTYEKGSERWKNYKIVCSATGELENEILNFAD